MPIYGSGFSAFGGQSIHEFQTLHNRDITRRVEQLTDEDLFDTDEGELVTRITAACQVKIPIIDFDHKTHDFVLAGTVPGYGLTASGVQVKQLVKYTLPVKGDVRLLEIGPREIQMLSFNSTPEVFAENGGVDGAIAFYTKDTGDSNAVVQASKAVLDNLRVNSGRLCVELENYNAGVPGTVQRAIGAEKQRRDQERKRIDDLKSRLP